MEVCREIYREGVLTNSMREGIISLLFKKGDTDQIKNWRPVTLLCVDLKLVAKVLTGRLKRALPSVIGEDQTCGIVGRQMVWNLHLGSGRHQLGARQGFAAHAGGSRPGEGVRSGLPRVFVSGFGEVGFRA